MTNKKMFFVKSFNICAYSMCFILLFGCTPNQKKLEEFASHKEYDKLYSYVERVNKKVRTQRKPRQIYNKNQKRYDFALTTLVGTKDTTIIKNIEKMFYERYFDLPKCSILQSFLQHGLVFEDKEKFYKEYTRTLRVNNTTALHDSMLARINDWRVVKYIYDDGAIYMEDFLNTFPMRFFKHPEVQKIKYEIELSILESEDLLIFLSEVDNLRKARSEYYYREISGYVIKQVEPGFYEVLVSFNNKHSILQTNGTHFSSAGYFSDIQARQIKKIPINTVGGFTDAWDLWAEVTDYEINKYSSAISNLKIAKANLKETQDKIKNLKRKTAALNK